MNQPLLGLLGPLFALALPATLALVAIFAPRRALWGATAGVALALGVVFCTEFGPWKLSQTGLVPTELVPTEPGTADGLGVLGLGVLLDRVTSVMLMLVTTLGLAVVRYSRTYLAGEAGQLRCLRWLLLTLSFVTTLVVSKNLAVVVLAWGGTSLALHQLLTFYPERTAALVAAHKKFILSRLADVALIASLALIQTSVGSLDIPEILRWSRAQVELPPAMQVAAILLVVAVALRTAQLPFHGWLTQVMEAPTPISALLHAGVVNIGGFVLIRLAPWFAHAHLAQTLLVLVGVVSATVAALVMTTRVSIKVALAWSTCAQMGFMLMQCGLGLWSLALLHLVAHSLYKAYAFLSAGTTVESWKLASLGDSKTELTPSRLLVAVGAALLVAGPSDWIFLWAVPDGSRPLAHASALLVGLSLVPLFSRSRSGAGKSSALAGSVLAVLVAYVAWHAIAHVLVPSERATASNLNWILAGLGVLGLFSVKTALELWPSSRFARQLHPWLFSGLYLDERFTRLTFQLWPPRFPVAPQVVAPQTYQLTLEPKV